MYPLLPGLTTPLPKNTSYAKLGMKASVVDDQ
jgi:hypothetical protein